MDIDVVIARVDQILVEEFELEPGRVVPSASLRDDLELDSLDALDLIVLLETEFEVKIDEKDLLGLSTLAEVHTYVRGIFAEAAIHPA